MEISGIISAIVIGIIIGVLGRLVLPGRQHIGILWTILVGIAAAFLGTAIAAGLGVADSKGIDWIEWLIQIGLAVVGVAALERVKSRR
ncbi:MULTISPECIES: GlsB/YeaQ/YmgE family stress response membrane protein [Streptomyces]|uniref:GlsB/YeaQ/YmgE family stress response membrane protein n=1 Tax=Streptomyces TaxID=1883 RepID=UPI00110FD43F|nr:MULTISPECIES: GlsB/YeaQ/YmgE family stress response membrane protein [Streptomyces]MBT2430354.1 GlsB/YeaQ/YmgE family stress response membrane protein [Streptomyces sp. ISL-112]MBT2466002.1 GlsB/YeaQ/YmgE family stress response membrane protein [Streptomyces sp. ISL-63]GGX40184.1 membrane protein [Streptomyces chryseus]